MSGQWQTKVVEWDNKIPFILVGVIIGMITYTGGENFGVVHGHHVLHSHWTHFVSNEVLMWVFFAFLGNEITLKEISQAGKFVSLATLGGMIVPPICVFALTGNIYIAIGAAATDVAFSVSASKIMTGGKKMLILMSTSLLILAVGDDLGGVAIMAGMYSSDISQGWLLAEVGILVFTYFCGERGVIPFSIRKKGGEAESYELIVEISSVGFWWLLAFANTAILHLAGVDWILGGCLAFLMAPEKVQKSVEHTLRPMIPLVLIFFGTVNGAINLLAPESWGWITAACFFGGMYGKQIGIFFGGSFGRAWCRRSSGNEGEKFAHMPTRQIYAMSVLGSCNGTVAIFFVTMGVKLAKILEEEAAQATLGFFFTVLGVYVQACLLRKTGWIKDNPAFMPDPPEEGGSMEGGA